MRTNQQGNFIRGGYPSHSRLNTVTTAAVFIIVGIGEFFHFSEKVTPHIAFHS